MTGPSDKKEKKSGSSLPCEVFFACTRCGARSRTVPQLHTHYRTAHKKEIANGTLTSKDSSESKPDKGLSSVEPTRTRSRAKLNSPANTGTSPSPSRRGRSAGPSTEDTSDDVVFIEGSKMPPKSGPVIKHPEKDCTITRKRNVPLGMLEGKKNSLMVIFQHSDQNKPLPEGSSFKLRNAGGEQTYMVVANVDVDIIEQGKPQKKAKTAP